MPPPPAFGRIPKHVWMLGGGMAMAMLLQRSLYTVKPGHRAMLFNNVTGLRPELYKEGWHMRIPGLHRPIIYDCRTRPLSLRAATGSRDLQVVELVVRVLFRPGADLGSLYRRVGLDYEEKVMPSVGSEVMRSVVARFNAAELLTRRSEVSSAIADELSSRAGSFGVLVDDVSITEMHFGKEFTEAVERKQVAQQEAERARYLVERAEQDKLSMVLLAEGQAESARLVGKAVQGSKEFLALRRLDAARDIAAHMASSRSRIFLDASSLLLDPFAA